ncbi:MAG TPA: pyridoxamine 5'-phosphate oxidase family protein [Thermodesulfobacteriota bacterium]
MPSAYHAGQLEVQARAGVRARARQLAGIVRPVIPPVAQAFLRDRRVVFLGSVEPNGRVWASALAGPPGFARAEDERTVRIDASPAPGDPLLDDVRATGRLGMLAIEFAARRRMRLGGPARVDGEGGLVLETERVLANCPKYIQARDLDAEAAARRDSTPSPRRAPALSDRQRAWIEGADTFFVATAPPDGGADVSHRGGRPGFVRVEGPTRVVFPDYPGNNMFLTLGNITANPRAGLLFLDFEAGGTLQVTGRARVNWDPAAAAAFPGAQRLVEFDVEEALESALPRPLRWRFLGYSPFDPDPPHVASTGESADGPSG